MKKSIFIIGLISIAFTLAAFGFMNRNDSTPPQYGMECSGAFDLHKDSAKASEVKPDFEIYYDVDSRFLMTMTKEELSKAKTYLDLFPREREKEIVTYSSMNITRFNEGGKNEQGVSGTSEMLNSLQIEELRSYYYSTNFVVTTHYQERNMYSGKLEDSYSAPHTTMVLEQEAYILLDKETLIDYVKKNTEPYAHLLSKESVKAGKVTFTVSMDGKVSQAYLTSTSGSTELDERVHDLILNMPITWIPAKDGKGLLLAQDFVFFFGMMGC